MPFSARSTGIGIPRNDYPIPLIGTFIPRNSIHIPPYGNSLPRSASRVPEYDSPFPGNDNSILEFGNDSVLEGRKVTILPCLAVWTLADTTPFEFRKRIKLRKSHEKTLMFYRIAACDSKFSLLIQKTQKTGNLVRDRFAADCVHHHLLPGNFSHSVAFQIGA